jgi:hypothetical protein
MPCHERLLAAIRLLSGDEQQVLKISHGRASMRGYEAFGLGRAGLREEPNISRFCPRVASPR